MRLLVLSIRVCKFVYRIGGCRVALSRGMVQSFGTFMSGPLWGILVCCKSVICYVIQIGFGGRFLGYVRSADVCLMESFNAMALVAFLASV